MKLRNLLCIVLLITLAACSHKHSRHGSGQGGADGDAYSMGIGEQDGFSGQDAANRLKAPHDQTYYFEYDDSTVHQEDLPSIQAQARYLANHPDARILLTGNTDERGSREYNVALGERRAMAIADVLKMQGVRASQIRIVSYGKEKPVDLGHDESAYHRNRRVELIYEAS